MKTDFKKQGKKNRHAGARFELNVRKDLESKGWIVSKWQNNVEFSKENIAFPITNISDNMGRLIPAKRKFNPFKKALSLGTGFPDFIAYKLRGEYYEGQEFPIIMGVEAKSNGYLDKEERAKCEWLIKNNIFSKILIARKSKERGKIEYTEFQKI